MAEKNWPDETETKDVFDFGRYIQRMATMKMGSVS